MQEASKEAEASENKIEKISEGNKDGGSDPCCG